MRSISEIKRAIQQDNIVAFLSNHRRYRILWWEFGPTLFEYLCKQKGLNAKELKQKNENREKLHKEYLKVLEAFGEMKAYWWWPWSSRVSEVILTESQKERAEKYASYSFLYRVVLVMFTSVLTHRSILFQHNGGYMKRNQQRSLSAPGGTAVRNINVSKESVQPDNGGYMKRNRQRSLSVSGIDVVRNIDVSTEAMQQPSDQQFSAQGENYSQDPSDNNHYQPSEEAMQQPSDQQFSAQEEDYSQGSSDNEHYQPSDPQAKPSGEGMESSAPGCSKSINFLEFAMVYQMNLEKALSSFGFSYKTLSSLDESLERVRNLGYSQEAISEYNQSFTRIFSKQYRESALKFHSDKGGNGMDTLNNIKEVMEELYETSKKERDIFRYKTFAQVALDFLHKNRDKFAGLINANVAAELRNITIWRQDDLLYSRNEFLEKTQKHLEVYLDNPAQLKQEFDKLVDYYIKGYQEFWFDNLIKLKFRCDKDKSLEVIKDEVKSLLKDSIGQYIRLANILPAREKIKKELKKMLPESFQIDQCPIDKCFVLPILEYNEVVQKYVELLSNCSIKHLTKIFEAHAKEMTNIEFDVTNDINSRSLAELQECIKSFKENSFPEIMSFMYGKTYCVPRSYGFGSREATAVEIGGMILVQILKKYVNLLKEEFQKEKTWFKRIEEEIHKLEKKIKEQHEMQKEAKQRADQYAEMAEQIKRVSKCFSRKIRSLDDELKDIVIDSQDEIVDAVVQHVMKHNSSAEQLLSSIIEEIKHNKTQVLRDGRVNPELINMGINRLLLEESSTTLSDVNVSQGASTSRSAGVGRR
ncbi:hypothetical protein [Wolbachia endosymbiont of Folsomia candida]|uniref:hypothetical protein n=1 Tax=Wolbachia endosymbiont of Folsomia candida TaxID=169402 RepID=UPI000AE9F799|nr:hypothetical protein [Wolbachia endosymbiont of Folsomia candida]APR98054.1 hypothetical protein ASM33_01915 [Wolbachia endosymbiont of Folsomia candida]